MKDDMMKYFKIIGQLQSVIAKADTLDEALNKGLATILEGCKGDYAVIWYADKNGENLLHPYYWICPNEFTGKTYRTDEGIVGEVYTSQKAKLILDYPDNPDERTDEDFSGIDISSFICVPLANKNESLGCIQLVKTEGQFSDEEADICEILSMMIAIEIDSNSKFQGNWTNNSILMSLRDIHKSFKNGDTISHVLKGVNLDVYEGEFLVLLGESGCGKSTFLNIIGGMDQADSGEITYMGKDMSKATQKELTEFRRDNVGFIFQSYNLMPNLNAKQNLDLIGELVDKPVSSQQALDMVGLGQKTASYPNTLSGGQQQRISIARALVKNPKLILADEPTAALDYETSITVLKVMEKVRDTGTTLIMVTHNEEISKMADRVVRFRSGRMYEVTVNRHPAKAEELVW